MRLRPSIPTVFTHKSFIESLSNQRGSASRRYLSSSPLPTHKDQCREDGHTSSLRSTSVSDGGSASVVSLFKEDFASAKVYMKELDFRQVRREALKRHMYKWYAIVLIIAVLTALITAKHDTIVDFMRPLCDRIKNWPGGFLIPIAALIVLSFPPLAGHERVCGRVMWVGMGVGFAILAAGTFLGEIATWIAFKWCCQARASKFEKKNKLYSSLTQLIREKSFMFVLILRFSAVPGHITTAVSASAGANFWSYLLAAFLTLPKQWTIVYLGKAFGNSTHTTKIVSAVTTVLTILATVVAAVYIYYQMRLVMRRQELAAAPDTATVSVVLSDFTDEKRDGLQSRRPWLSTEDGAPEDKGGFRTPTRSWSMPGHMNDEELRAWLAEIKNEKAMAASTGVQGEGIGVAEGAPAIKVEGVTILDDLPPAFSAPPSPKLLDTAATTPGNSSPAFIPQEFASLSPSPSLLELNNSHTPTTASRRQYKDRRSVSDTSSIYEPSPGSGTSTPRRYGGREMADDADAYAVAHGGQRPDFRRMRGDSRAALLGRPVDDAALDMSGSSWKREYSYGRSRGDSASTTWSRPMIDELGRSRGDSVGTVHSGRPTLEDIGVVRGENGWARTDNPARNSYGRRRGESAAGLLGRPDDDEVRLRASSAGRIHSRRESDWEVLKEDEEVIKGDENV
ncbi:hypothetical protein B9479_002909 [Cryptococcus floricola]|uniref:Golgi apparatus membrane protein TVP38 n=1 Tax=Cryptococcus floricola TaxID=2591691 RepID=A0A5D3B1E1_9TREE|nr:hypothetical protein B9479_002909 [Cryptococcus floricola]